MLRISTIKTCLLILFLPVGLHLNAQQAEQLDKDERQEVIDSLNAILGDNYVFPEVAEKMAALLNQKMSDGEYDAIYEPQVYAQQLTSDLQSISHDLHLRVNFAPQQVTRMREMAAAPDDEDANEEWMANQRFGNFGFQEVKFLEGNIG